MNASKKLILAFLASAVFAGAPLTINAQQVGTILGSATVVDADGNESALTTNTEISLGDEIVTTGNGQVTITFADGTELTISPNSRVIITSASNGATVVTVVSGSIIANAGTSLTVNTVNGSTVASNGSMGVTVGPNGNTTVSNVNGTVTTTPSGGAPQSVPPATKVVVSRDANGQIQTSAPQNLTTQEIAQITNGQQQQTQQNQFQNTPETTVDLQVISESEPKPVY